MDLRSTLYTRWSSALGGVFLNANQSEKFALYAATLERCRVIERRWRLRASALCVIFLLQEFNIEPILNCSPTTVPIWDRDHSTVSCDDYCLYDIYFLRKIIFYFVFLVVWIFTVFYWQEPFHLQCFIFSVFLAAF